MARWQISESDRQAVVEQLVKIALSDDWPVAIRAARVLIAMDAQNLKWSQAEHLELKNRIQSILAQRQGEN